MGKGDIKTRRGKIANKSYGARRKKKIKKRTSVEEKVAVDKAKKG
ncbi:30S ribosomal protein THX [Allomuricauda sp. SCSIO 65647]|nr:30S ribosomal protein THX [Muricauda sp. SCSIO 65647]UJH68088.1 30S ribosomal protein THX [Muricauda sp. SCSIO 65647]